MEKYVKLLSRYFFSGSIVQACSRNGILKYKFKEYQWFAPRTNKTEKSFDWFFKLNSQALIIQSFEGFKRGTKCEAKWDLAEIAKDRMVGTVETKLMSLA